MALTDGLLISHPPLDTWTSLRSRLSLTDAFLFSEPDAITVLELGLQRLVYISARGDGRPGKGTLSDPFNGSTPDKFDALMRSIPDFTEIVLLPGTYLTRGYNGVRLVALGYGGWTVKPGWKLRGCGIAVTTIKLVEPEPKVTNLVVHGYWDGSVNPQILFRNFAEVSDMTIDCNGPALFPQPDHAESSPSSATLNAIHLSGSHVRISRVRCINWMSGKWITSGVDAQNPGECFVMGISGPNSSLVPHQPHVAQYIIEDCIVEQPYWIDNTGATCIQISGGGLGDGSLQFGYYATVQRNYINGEFPTGQKYGYATTNLLGAEPGRFGFNGMGFGCGYGFIYQDNRVVNVSGAGPYLDTFPIKENIVRDNTYHNIIAGPNYALGSTSERQIYRLTHNGAGIATAYTYYDHLQLDGQRTTIACPTHPGYSVTKVPITVTSRRTFTYPIPGSPTTPVGLAEPGDFMPTPLALFTSQWATEKLLVENNDMWMARSSEYLNFNTAVSCISVHTGSHDPLDGEYNHDEVVVRGNRIQLLDGDMNPLNKAGHGILIAETRKAIIEDNIIKLPISQNYGFGLGIMTFANPKNHIFLHNVGSYICRNNIRPEDNSYIHAMYTRKGGLVTGWALTEDCLYLNAITFSVDDLVAYGTAEMELPNPDLTPGDFVQVFQAYPENFPYNGLAEIIEVNPALNTFRYKLRSIPSFNAIGQANIISLTSVGLTATAILEHPNYRLVTGDMVTIVGVVNEPNYNITASITVINNKTFTYPFAGGLSPAAPAPGDVMGARTTKGQLGYQHHKHMPDLAYEPQKMAALML